MISELDPLLPRILVISTDPTVVNADILTLGVLVT
jgi:hypothetical protein